MTMSQKMTAVLMAVGIVGVGVLAHAAPPTGKTPLQTYSCNRVNNCYKGLGTNKSGWIAAHDDLIRIYEIRSDGWVRGDYPSGSSRVTRWFKFGDLVTNGNFSNRTENINRNNVPVYRTYNSGSTIGSVYNNESVTVVDECGNRKCIVYRLSNGSGYKMGWVDKSCFGNVAVVSSSNVRNQVGQCVANISSYRLNLDGYSAIQGQCVWYVRNRGYEKLGAAGLTGVGGNAKYWYNTAKNKGRAVGYDPRPNSIACWTGGTYGHVAFVEDYDGSYVYFTEANYGQGTNGVVKKLSLSKFRDRYPYGYAGCIYLQ